MSEFSKVIIGFVLLIVLCFGMFCFGYILSNKRAVERINEANKQLAEQQRKYDELIREAEERLQQTNDRLRDIREQLSAKVSNNGQTIKELSGIIEQIKRQRIDI